MIIGSMSGKIEECETERRGDKQLSVFLFLFWLSFCTDIYVKYGV